MSAVVGAHGSQGGFGAAPHRPDVPPQLRLISDADIRPELHPRPADGGDCLICTVPCLVDRVAATDQVEHAAPVNQQPFPVPSGPAVKYQHIVREVMESLDHIATKR